MEMFKKWWKQITIAGIIGALVVVGDAFGFVSDLYARWTLSAHSHEVQLFEDTSAILDHRFDSDGKLYLKYQTCNPPIDTPDYYYVVWIDGLPHGERRPAAGHFSINSWFKPLFCTEGWWGQIGFEGAHENSEVVVTWYWLLDDGNYQETNMRYIVDRK